MKFYPLCFPLGVWPHFHVPGVTGGGEVWLKLIPLNVGELKVLDSTHSTDPMLLWEGEVGLEKHIKYRKKKIIIFLFLNFMVIEGWGN